MKNSRGRALPLPCVRRDTFIKGWGKPSPYESVE